MGYFITTTVAPAPPDEAKPLTPVDFWGVSGQRYYSPGTGRWVQKDRVEEYGGLNLYASMHNDPVGSVDILGLLYTISTTIYLDYPEYALEEYLYGPRHGAFEFGPHVVKHFDDTVVADEEKILTKMLRRRFECNSSGTFPRVLFRLNWAMPDHPNWGWIQYSMDAACSYECGPCDKKLGEDCPCSCVGECVMKFRIFKLYTFDDYPGCNPKNKDCWLLRWIGHVFHPWGADYFISTRLTRHLTLKEKKACASSSLDSEGGIGRGSQ